MSILGLSVGANLFGSSCMSVPVKIRRHWGKIADMGCIVCGMRPATIHHAHSRELSSMGFSPGVAQKQSHWLCIPLCVPHHVGDHGVDRIGVETWEATFGSQVDLLRTVQEVVGYDIFKLARNL